MTVTGIGTSEQAAVVARLMDKAGCDTETAVGLYRLQEKLEAVEEAQAALRRLEEAYQ